MNAITPGSNIYEAPFKSLPNGAVFTTNGGGGMKLGLGSYLDFLAGVIGIDPNAGCIPVTKSQANSQNLPV